MNNPERVFRHRTVNDDVVIKVLSQDISPGDCYGSSNAPEKNEHSSPRVKGKGLTPGITRRPERLPEHDKRRVGGRVHAVVRRGIDRHSSLRTNPDPAG